MVGYEYHPDAEAEYHDAIRYYSRLDAELALSFVDEIERIVECARSSPELHRVVTEKVRRILARRFPYAVFYEVREDRILIWAVAHTSREPGYWKRRFLEGTS